MGFADAYLQGSSVSEARIDSAPDPGLHFIVTLPVHRESGLERCLDSLFSAAAAWGRMVEILVLFNASEDASELCLEINQSCFEATERWIAAHPSSTMSVNLLREEAMPRKHAGVGLARKILMDEAIRRFSGLNRPGGIIASMDADTVVDSSYFQVLDEHFRDPLREGCSIYFEHPLNAGEDAHGHEAEEVYHAIGQYELHLRYYLHALRSTGYPHAFHTIGSAFAVRASAYVAEGGMNRRQGGEDFYFIQKLAQRGRWSDCTGTRVIPSPRPSDRVPFGTGPVVARLEKTGRLDSYNLKSFRILQSWFSTLDRLYSGPLKISDPLLEAFLESQDIFSALDEIRSNAASPESFRKRFWRWFNMFRIMKFLHFARDRGLPDGPVEEQAATFLQTNTCDPFTLLNTYRNLDRS